MAALYHAPACAQPSSQAIEVRVGQQGVKAKWVRIELRKIETLPGGGVANTFFDFVGASPVNLWQSPNDEYSTLHTVESSLPSLSPLSAQLLQWTE